MRRLYQKDDLLSASLVWYSRRQVIEQVLLHENPHLSDTDVKAIMQGCLLYSTCSEELFDQLAAEADARQARVQEAA